MNEVNVEMYTKKISAAKLKKNSLLIPKYVQVLLTENKIHGIKDDDEKARMFIRLMFKRKISGKTIKRYYDILKPALFPTTMVIPNSMVFDKTNDKAPQLRGSNFIQVDNLIRYIRKLNDEINYKWCVLFALYTGLRSAEVIQLKASHILQLEEEKLLVSIIRKNNVTWNVLYYDEFQLFIKQLRDRYNEEVTFYIQHNVDVVLFNFTTMSLHYKLKEYYRESNKGLPPPTGFGLHIFRYYVASKLALKKLDVAQSFLGHKNKKTTEKYIRYNDLQKEQELQNINNQNDLYRNMNERLTNNLNGVMVNEISFVEF